MMKKVDFSINQPVVKLFEHLSLMPEIAKIKVNSVDKQNYKIHLSDGISFGSWGEKVTISFFDPMDGGTRIIVESTPKIPVNIFDLGKNRKNVELIRKFVETLPKI